MMNLGDFTKYINRLQKHVERVEKLSDLLMSEGGLIDIGDTLVYSIVELLVDHFKDKSEWISYWIWELGFGEKYVDGSVTLDDEIVPLKTIEDLYNVLVDDYEEAK